MFKTLLLINVNVFINNNISLSNRFFHLPDNALCKHRCRAYVELFYYFMIKKKPTKQIDRVSKLASKIFH